MPCYPDWLCWFLISWSTWPHISFYLERTATLKSPFAPPILVHRVPKASKQLRFPELLTKQFIKWFDKLLKNSIEVNWGPSAPKVFSISSHTIVMSSLSLNLLCRMLIILSHTLYTIGSSVVASIWPSRSFKALMTPIIILNALSNYPLSTLLMSSKDIDCMNCKGILHTSFKAILRSSWFACFVQTQQADSIRHVRFFTEREEARCVSWDFKRRNSS